MFKVRVAIIVVLLSFAPSAISATAQTFLYLNSQPGDYVGQGMQQKFTPADGPFVVNYSNGGLQISFHTPNYSSDWYLNFGAPTGSKLVRGEYEDAQVFAFHSPTKPGMDVYGDGRGCNGVASRFLVSQLTFAADGSVLSLAVDFEQHCEGFTAALYGSVRINSAVSAVPRVSVGDATALKGNVGANAASVMLSLSIPSTQPVSVQYSTADGGAVQGTDYVATTATALFQPGTTSQTITIPIIGDRLARGNKVFHVRLSNASGAPIGDGLDNVKILDPNVAMKVLSMYGQPGDYISPGLFLATIADGVFTPSHYLNNNVVNISLTTGDWWETYFVAPNNALLTAGTYENARDYANHPAGTPGLSVYGAGRGCTVTGRFVVNKAIYTTTGALRQFSADFEQHCEGWAAGLFGSIRINSKLTQVSVSDAVIDTVQSTATFTVTLNPASATSVSVNFVTADGTAAAGVNYVATSQTVVFSPGQLQQTVAVPLLSLQDGTKQFFGQLTAPGGAPVWIRQGVAGF